VLTTTGRELMFVGLKTTLDVLSNEQWTVRENVDSEPKAKSQ
jgi:hypothetical protein